MFASRAAKAHSFQSRRIVYRVRLSAGAGACAGVVLACVIASVMGVFGPALNVLVSTVSPAEEAAIQDTEASDGALPPQTSAQRERLAALRARADVLHKRNASQLRARRAIGPYIAAVHVGKRENLAALADIVAAVPGGGVIFDVKGSRVYFHTTSMIAKQLDLVSAGYDLSEVIAYLKGRGLYTMARFVAVKDEGMAQADPSTQIRHPVTGESVGDVWVNPGHSTVIAYNQQVLEDVVRAGIDEVNFDYIRYPTEYALADVGLSADEKAERVEMILTMARETVDAAGGQTRIGISTYAILGWDFATNNEYLGQDFIRFAPLVDVISPMAYPSSFGGDAYYVDGTAAQSRMYTLVYQTLKGYADLLGPEQARKLRPWLQGFSIDEQDLRDQVEATYDAGACGFTVWNPASRYGPLISLLQQWKPPPTCPS